MIYSDVLLLSAVIFLHSLKTLELWYWKLVIFFISVMLPLLLSNQRSTSKLFHYLPPILENLLSYRQHPGPADLWVKVAVAPLSVLCACRGALRVGRALLKVVLLSPPP